MQTCGSDEGAMKCDFFRNIGVPRLSRSVTSTISGGPQTLCSVSLFWLLSPTPYPPLSNILRTFSANDRRALQVTLYQVGSTAQVQTSSAEKERSLHTH